VEAVAERGRFFRFDEVRRMKRNCPKCDTEVKKTWPMPKHPELTIGRCSTCKKVVNLGRTDGATGNAGDGVKKTTQSKKEKEGGKGAGHKAASGSGRKQRSSEPSVSSQPAAKRGGFGAGIRDFFDF
jgi:hypothetical protein